MKKFVVAFVNHFDNLLKQTVVEAPETSNEIEVAVNYLNELNDGWNLEAASFETIDAVAEYCFDSECNISVIEIT